MCKITFRPDEPWWLIALRILSYVLTALLGMLGGNAYAAACA